MNVHINGVEMRSIDLITEHVARRGKVRAHFRAMIKGDRAALNRVFKERPAKLVLERAPSDPTLAHAFKRGLAVRVRGHRYRVYYRDSIRNRIHLREIEL